MLMSCSVAGKGKNIQNINKNLNIEEVTIYDLMTFNESFSKNIIYDDIKMIKKQSVTLCMYEKKIG